MTPIVPPDAAFAVDGLIDPRVAAALTEARRIRDGQRAAVAAAQATATIAARARLRRALAALHRWAAQERARCVDAARALAVELATRVVAEARAAQIDAHLARACAQAPADAAWLRIHLAPADLGQLGATLPAGVEVVADPGLEPGDLWIEHPRGRIDARARSCVARGL